MGACRAKPSVLRKHMDLQSVSLLYTSFSVFPLYSFIQGLNLETIQVNHLSANCLSTNSPLPTSSRSSSSGFFVTRSNMPCTPPIPGPFQSPPLLHLTSRSCSSVPFISPTSAKLLHKHLESTLQLIPGRNDGRYNNEAWINNRWRHT